MPYESSEDIHTLLAQLKKEGIRTVAVEQTAQAQAYTNLTSTEDTAFVFGNEITGIEEDVLCAIETHIQIPMHGTKESLNVSVCAGIVLFHFRA